MYRATGRLPVPLAAAQLVGYGGAMTTRTLHVELPDDCAALIDARPRKRGHVTSRRFIVLGPKPQKWLRPTLAAGYLHAATGDCVLDYGVTAGHVLDALGAAVRTH
jgi:hypothetical protein